MPRPEPHPLALFSLKPHNPRAHDAIAHPSNIYLHSKLPNANNALALDVGFNIHSQSRNTLATLGRGDTDIIVEGSSIGRVQCSFEIDQDSRAVMLYDRSNAQTTQVFGDNATPFEHGRLRRVVVQKGLNTIIGMGGVGCDLIQFELIWHQGPVNTAEKVKSQEGMRCGQEENPRLARTVDEAPTILPSQRVTRIHTPGERKLRIRYEKIGSPLGSGEFGIVHKCIDVDSGKLMAVKILKPPPGKAQEDWREGLNYTLKREVETLSAISHPHIVDYIASQGWDGQEVEIFMGLKEGTLGSLLESGADASAVADFVFPQILRALDCLAYNGIVHRDVKPENILYVSQPGGQYQFQLGDFGLCNRAIDAATRVGSLMFMAPEMFRKGGQTSKLDVWSLFVTMLWTLDAGGFRQRSKKFKTVEDAQEAVLHAASRVDSVLIIQEMAADNPKKRASAAQMLVKYYNGVGLSTPRNQVPALIDKPVATTVTRTTRNQVPALIKKPVATTETRTPALHARKTRLPELPAAALYRINKPRRSFRQQTLPQIQDLRTKPARAEFP